MSRISIILNEAADLLVKHGWCQGTRQRMRDGALCMLGAVSMVEEGHPYARCDEIRDALEESLGAQSVAHWNDTDDRTDVEAIEALRQAAEEWE